MSQTDFTREIYRDILQEHAPRRRERAMLDLLRDAKEPILSSVIATACGITTKDPQSRSRAVRKMAERLRDAGHPVVANDCGYWLSRDPNEILTYCKKRRSEIEIMYHNALATVDRMEASTNVRNGEIG